MQVVTVATMRTLARTRALVASLRRNQSDWPVSVLLIGGEAAVAAAARAERSIAIESVSQLLDVDVETLLARHDGKI